MYVKFYYMYMEYNWNVSLEYSVKMSIVIKLRGYVFGRYYFLQVWILKEGYICE